MRLAQAKSETDPQSAALMFRDGLMIAVVAFHGNRRREILELEDGTNIQKTEAGYVLQVYARNSKTKKPNRSDINRVFVEVIDEYRTRHRPVLVQLYKKESGKETQAFFVSPSIGRMGGTRISAIFARRTKQVLGTSWSPQQFRRAITSDAVRRDPKLVMLAAAVNRHSLQVAMKHYNAAQRSAAERRFQEIFDMALDEANL
jgi:integrase